MIFNLICVNWEKSLTFLLQLILYGLGLERTLHSKYTSSPSLIFDPLSEKPRLRMAWGTSKRVTNSIFTSICWIKIIFLQVIESFQPSSKLPSPVCWSAARQPRNVPASFMVGIKTNVLRVTFPSGLVWWNKDDRKRNYCLYLTWVVILSLICEAPLHQVTFGGGLAPTTWHLASNLLPADIGSLLLIIFTLSGPTSKHLISKCYLNIYSQCKSILTDVETGLLMLLFEAWQVKIEWRSFLWRSSIRRILMIFCGSEFS